MMPKATACFVCSMLFAVVCNGQKPKQYVIDSNSFRPRSYICQQTKQGINIDGSLEDEDWQRVPWTELFVDIEGEKKSDPPLTTRVKMLWDSHYIYFGAELEEPHIWGNLRQRDTVIFHDNDFEIFIDPTGDTHHYIEFEINALGTIWDLMITKPYRDNGLVLNGWDIHGIRHAVGINGTINSPADRDSSWTVEVAIPLASVKEACRGWQPRHGDVWRMNFSRVQWHTDIVNGCYVKRTNGEGKKLPEENWVWSPQGVIAMHQPETWGFVQFSGTDAGSPAAPFEMKNDEWVKWALRHIYYRQSDHLNRHGRVASLEELHMVQILCGELVLEPQLMMMGRSYQARIASTQNNGWWCIREDGYVWKESY